MALSDRPCEKIGIDLCECERENYLVIDYYSKYLEVLHMPTTTQVVLKLKATFVRYGIAEEVVSDGPQFSSDVFSVFKQSL